VAELLETVESTALATALRGSTWAYPLANAGHIVGVALLVGGIVPVDLRLLGVWRDIPLAFFLRVFTPVSIAGFGLAALFGGLLFVVNAGDYAISVFFQAKMGMLALGLANAMAFRAVHPAQATGDPGRGQRAIGAASLVIWLSVIVLGRLIGYF